MEWGNPLKSHPNPPNLRDPSGHGSWRRRVPPRREFRHLWSPRAHLRGFSGAFIGPRSRHDHLQQAELVPRHLPEFLGNTWKQLQLPPSTALRQHKAGEFRNFLPSVKFPFSPGFCLVVPTGIGSVLLSSFGDTPAQAQSLTQASLVLRWC